MAKTTKHPAEKVVKKYIDDVLAGIIPASEWTKKACQRHLDDMTNGAARGLYFDRDDAQFVIDFFRVLKHSKGKWAGKPFDLAPWQKFILWVLFGWKRADGTRRFRIAYTEVSRKNGKSTLAAGIGLYLLVADGEAGAEVYSAATKMDQAKIIHQEAIRMVRKSPSLKKRCGICVNNIHVAATHSKFEPLGADAKTMDGLNPHGATVDELHAHPDGSVWDVLRSAIGARTQPLLFAITTAGFNTQSFCYTEQRDYATKVLDGLIEDDSYFAIIYTLDRGSNGELLDDWKDESVWLKSNPNLGISVSLDDMREMCKEAESSAAKLNNFLVKKLNIWTTQDIRWIDMEKWQACDDFVDEKDLEGYPCYAALDLSSNIDISCWGLLFPNIEGKTVFLPRFFIPKDNALARAKRDRVPYLQWIQDGYIFATPGNVIDYEFIDAQIEKDFQRFDIRLVGIDRWGFEPRRQRLEALGVPISKMVAFGQGYASMNSPLGSLEKMYYSGDLVHNNNPVLSWMASNMAVKQDPAGNIKPAKDKSSEKIDGMVTLTMSLGVYEADKTVDVESNLRNVGI